MSFSRYLAEQLNTHPEMAPRDVFKLCYQAARGAEHLLHDTTAAERYFAAEWDKTAPCDGLPLAEPISDAYCRVNLAAWKARELPSEWLFSLFVKTASTPAEGDLLADFLSDADAAVRKGVTAFSLDEWECALSEYRAAGTPAIHHGEGYRAAYAPAYRVVSRRWARLIPLLEAVAAKKRDTAPLILAIDGRAASGKSTLARELAAIFGASTVHMDDFFLPPALRTEARLAEAGGNIHYERFLAEVLPCLAAPEGFSYRVFDCGRMTLDGERAVANAPVRIVEGSYAHHPAFGDYAHIKVFCTVDADEQMARILRRNGAAMAERFRTEWIPMEEAYFSAYDIRGKADIVFRPHSDSTQ